MPAGRYVVMDGESNPVGSEDFRCAPGPAGWRYVADITTSLPVPHHEKVDLAVDQDLRPVRVRIETGSHELLLASEGDRLSGHRDGEALETPWSPEMHLDYLSPAFNAVTANRLMSTADIQVVFVERVTLEPRIEPQRYELLGEQEVETPVGRFTATRWRYTALSTGWTSHLWVAGDVVVAYQGLYALEWYEWGASGPRPS